MKPLYLVAETGGARFALPASAVHSVVTSGEIVPTPLSGSYVDGLTAIRSHVVTVINIEKAISGRGAAAMRGQSLVVVTVDGHHYGLAVDEILDVYEYDKTENRIGAAFSPVWRIISTGFIEVEGNAVVVIDATKLVNLEPGAVAA